MIKHSPHEIPNAGKSEETRQTTRKIIPRTSTCLQSAKKKGRIGKGEGVTTKSTKRTNRGKGTKKSATSITPPLTQ